MLAAVPNRRRDIRRATHIRAEIDGQLGVITDMSPCGCRFQTSDVSWMTGDLVTVRTTKGSRTATVRWTDEKLVGLCFADVSATHALRELWRLVDDLTDAIEEAIQSPHDLTTDSKERDFLHNSVNKIADGIIHLRALLWFANKRADEETPQITLINSGE